MVIPCKDCLILPICRQKDYHDLLCDCVNLMEYLVSENFISRDIDLHKKRFRKFESYIKPTKWKSGGETQMGYELYKI